MNYNISPNRPAYCFDEHLTDVYLPEDAFTENPKSIGRVTTSTLFYVMPRAFGGAGFVYERRGNFTSMYCSRWKGIVWVETKGLEHPDFKTI
jgi:hypothetical protein